MNGYSDGSGRAALNSSAASHRETQISAALWAAKEIRHLVGAIVWCECPLMNRQAAVSSLSS
jgi:hypothetical protein